MKMIQRMFVKQLLAVFVPCVVAVIFYIVILSVQVNSNSNVHHIESIEDTIARIQVYKQLETKLNVEVETKDVQEQLYTSLEHYLLQVNSDLIVIEDNNLIYQSSNLQNMNKEWLLTKIRQKHTEVSSGKEKYLLHYVSNEFQKNKQFVFVYKQIKGVSGQTLALLVALVAFLITYIGCCLYINSRLNRKLIKPIMKIKDAAVQISAGELDSIIVVDTQDEIEDLSKSLEFLRLKLKESIRLQQKYDDNRSFLISSISHDLRTPVTTIKGYVEALRDGIANSPERREQYLHIIDKKASQINEMIEDLLLYSKLDLNQLPFNFKKINLINYLQDGIEEYDQFFKTNSVEVSFNSYVTNAVEVNIDLMRFMRVIQNIWNNAVFYNDKAEKKIEISLRETFSSYVVEIKDNGKGIEADEAKHIFERFYRTDRARQSDQGSGLGLAIAKHIIEAHQGQIWARGEIGKGTSIYISLPKIKE